MVVSSGLWEGNKKAGQLTTGPALSVYVPNGLEDGCVCVSVHKLARLGGVGHPDLDHPAFSVGIAVDSLGSFLQSCVDLDDLT